MRIGEILVGFAVFAAFVVALIAVDAFETLHRISRDHEDWELDDIVLAFFSLLVGVLFTFVLTARRRAAEAEAAQAELMRARDELSHALAEARELAELADSANKEKSRFLASISHELRTPLNGILTMSTLLKSEESSTDRRRKLQVISDSGQVLLALLNDILDIAKIEAGKVEIEGGIFSVPDLVRSVSTMMMPQIEKKGLAFQSGLDLGFRERVRGDEARIRQVLINLIGNAVKFTDEGKIGLMVGYETEQPGLLRFEVTDTGIGIGAEDAARVFEPFYQADSSMTRSREGAGLGLAISKKLAVLMGGDVGFQSTPGRGSRFWFTVAVEPAEEPSGAEGAADTAAARLPDGLRVLVAEDHRLNQIVIRAVLEAHKCEVDLVTNGLEAVEAVRGSDYDLVLMDVQMPEMDGVTATREIRAIGGPRSRTPIIALTANAMRGDEESYLEAGMNAYVAKPIEEDVLVARMLSVLATAGAAG